MNGRKKKHYWCHDETFLYRFQEYVVAKNVDILYPVPDGLAMDVAALIPCSGVTAYAAIKRVEPVVKDFIASRG